jgi:hypothetical protein
MIKKISIAMIALFCVASLAFATPPTTNPGKHKGKGPVMGSIKGKGKKIGFMHHKKGNPPVTTSTNPTK